MARRFPILPVAAVVLAALIPGQAGAQKAKDLTRKWWFGGSLGLNLNSHSADIRQMNSTVSSPVPFTDGSGTGLFLGPMVEYRHDPVWGAMVALAFDGRGGSFDDVSDAATGTGTLSTSMNYISLEPSVRVAPFPSDVFLFAGPRLAFNVAKSFEYGLAGGAPVTGDFSGTRGAVISGQVGVGMDFVISGQGASTQVLLAPFFAVHFGQGPRTEETWGLTTFRAGVSVKFAGMGGSSSDRAEGGEGVFTVRAPRIIPAERRVQETFPTRNYVFFEPGSTAIPARYVTLSAADAAAFHEDHLLEAQPKDLTGRSRRQMTVYHNVLNVVGDRMRRFREATVDLSGSSESGAAEGKEMAESVKKYLVDAFGIEAGRIRTKGSEKPSVPSAQRGATRELELVRPEDRRVEITSSASGLLDPVQIISLQEDPLDSDVLVTVPGAAGTYASWSIEATGDDGKTQRFGPYTREQERIPGRAILGDRLQGQYTLAMVGETKDGQTVRREEKVRLARSDEADENTGWRFSILFEFDQSKTVATYNRFLTNEVAPLVPAGGSVIIHGHTDVVGEESYNLRLSRERATETMEVLQAALAKAGKKNVRFDTYGFGEDARRAPFENTLPEERFYNRTVIIDIVPE